MKRLLVLLVFYFSAVTIASSQDPSGALLLYSGTVYPSENLDRFLSESISNDEIVNGYYYRIIQFNEFPDENLKKEIASSGIIFNSYLPYRAYNCAIPQNFNRNKLLQMNVHSVLTWNEINKIHREIDGVFPAHVIIERDHADLLVHYQQNLSASSARELFNNAGIKIINSLDPIHTFIVRIPFSKIEKLKGLPFVYFIEPIAPPSKKDDTEGRSLHRSNMVNADNFGGRHYDGSGVTIGLADDGEIGPHIDFTGRLTQHLTGAGGNHGDMTSGICVGAGNLIQRIKGMGTGAYLHVFDINGYPHVTNAVNNYNNYGIVILSTSYAQVCNQYTTDSEFGDDLIHDYPQFQFCFSAGNEGTTDCNYGAGNLWGNITGGYKLGKNVVAVGNLSETDALASSSSRGPAADGRIKPDICSYGNYQTSTDENNAFQQGSGTSAACPGVAGCFSQLYQAYKEINSAPNPPGALIKACVLNTGDDLGNTGPDFKYGWGRINTFRALTTLEDHRYFSDSVGQGQSKSNNINVPAGVKQLRVMLYWSDLAGNPAVVKQLVNDLNLVVTDPSANTFTPWVLDPTPTPTALNSLPVRGIDSLNNVEQVTIDNPAQGSYTIDVNGFQVPLGKQEYYVVYEFLTDSIKVTYPNGGEGIVPGETELIRWDAFGNSGTFNVRYSANNGSTWNNIVTGLPSAQRYYSWNVPIVLSDQVIVEVSRNGISDVSDTMFTIMRAPGGLHVTFVCPDSIGLAWTALTGATGYTVSMLGTKYMDPVGSTTATSFTIHGIDPAVDHWVSVNALGPNGGKGYRANAIRVPAGLSNCSLSVNGTLLSILNPAPGVNTSCQDFSNTHVMVKIKNNGINSISNFQINYSFDGGSVVSENFPLPIAAGAAADYTFSQSLTMPSSGTHDLKTWISLSGDVYPNDDSSNAEVSIIPGTAGPANVYETFETMPLCSTTSDCESGNCTMRNGWINATNNTHDNIDWRVAQGATPSTSTGPDVDHTTGNATGNYIYLEASTCYNREADLLSPCIDLSGVSTPRLAFWYHMYGTDMGELHLDVIGENQVYTDYIPPHVGPRTNTWFKDSADLSQFAGQTIVLKFRGITGNGLLSDMALDDINVFDVTTGIEGSQPLSQFVIYPNPGKGLFYYSTGAIAGRNALIKVYDILGEVVFEKSLSDDVANQEGVIDLSALSNGVYSVSFRSEAFERIERIMKLN